MSGDSELIGHEPCPECGSRDNLGRYDDGHGFCFGCNYYEHGDGEPRVQRRSSVSGDLISAEYRPLAKRKISEDACRKLDYRSGKWKGRNVQAATYYDADGRVCAQHLRFPDKSFQWVGDAKAVTLFGQQAWRDGGRKVIVTEGEIDALTMSDVQGNRWPVVSVPNGAASASKYIKRSLQWLLGFDEVVFIFDSDAPGEEAALECARLLPPGRAKISKLPYKDANEALLEGNTACLADAVWNGKEFRPDGIVSIADIKEDLMKPVEWGIDWPWEELTKATYGIRRGEIYAWGAGTGVGKTDAFTQIAAHLVEKGHPVGLIFLEAPPRDVVQRVAGKMKGRRFHIPDADWTKEEWEAAVEELEAANQVYLYQHFGSIEWEPIQATIRYYAHAYGIKDVFLDHLTALAAHADDERKALEEIMADLASLAQELGITIYFVSHLATPEGKPHEEGGRVMIRHFKGSRAIGYWSHFMFGLERDTQSDDPDDRHTTTLRVLKDRNTGKGTGETIPLVMDLDTGLLRVERREVDLSGEGEDDF